MSDIVCYLLVVKLYQASNLFRGLLLLEEDETMIIIIGDFYEI